MKRALLSFLCTGLLACTAQALMQRIPFERIVRESPWIVRARVTSLDSRWLDDRRNIVTDVKLVVDESWKGDLAVGATVAVLVPGGKVGRITETVEHQPTFAPGEDVVLFLRGPASGARSVTYLEQGKLTVAGSDVITFDQQAKPLATLRADVSRLAPARGR